MIASSRINSNTDFKKIDGTPGSFTVEGGDLLVTERNSFRQSHTHHSSLYPIYQKPFSLNRNIRNFFRLNPNSEDLTSWFPIN